VETGQTICNITDNKIIKLFMDGELMRVQRYQRVLSNACRQRPHRERGAEKVRDFW
jgi:hypothetical protein